MSIFKKYFASDGNKLVTINKRLETIEKLLLFTDKLVGAIDEALAEFNKLADEIVELTDLVAQNRHMIIQISSVMEILFKSINPTSELDKLDIGDMPQTSDNKTKLPN